MIKPTATEPLDVYARVTDQIVAAIKNGVGTWKMPWHTSGQDAFSPVNVSSRKAYRGVNCLSLWAAAEAKGYTSASWELIVNGRIMERRSAKVKKRPAVVFAKCA